MGDKITISANAGNEDGDENQATPEASVETEPQPDQSSAAAEDDTVLTLTEKLAAAETAASENYDRFLRVSAEFDNFKKRSAKELNDFRKYANEALLKDLLQVVDNLERALETCDAVDGAAAIREGVDLTLKDLLKVFGRFNVELVTAVGRPFDPVFHQAVMQEPSATVEANTVIRELQKGYTLNGRLLRPAMVVVATEMTAQPDDTANQ